MPTTRALFAGDIRESLRRAAQISQQVHVKYAGRRYRRVVALLDSHYDELWVGGKASYKLGAIIEPGGELIIYAPHLTHISITHGRLIEKYGYAPLEEVREMVDGSDELRANLAVAAHLAHVAYAGRRPPTAGSRRATASRWRRASPKKSRAGCKLGFLDHRAFDVARVSIRSRYPRRRERRARPLPRQPGRLPETASEGLRSKSRKACAAKLYAVRRRRRRAASTARPRHPRRR